MAIDPGTGSQRRVQVSHQTGDLGSLGASAVTGVFEPRCCCGERRSCLIAARVTDEYFRSVMQPVRYRTHSWRPALIVERLSFQHTVGKVITTGFRHTLRQYAPDT